MHISKICSTFAVEIVFGGNKHSVCGAVRVVIRDRFFMFYNIFLGKKYEKMQKNAKKCKKIAKKFAYIKNLL